MNIKKCILLSAAFATSVAFATIEQPVEKAVEKIAEKTAEQINLKRVLQTGSCYQCDLTGVNLSGFQPGNPQNSQNPFIDAGKHAGWLTMDLQRTKWVTADLSKTDFTITMRGYVTPLRKVLFNEADLRQANLSQARFYATDFSKANLSSANLMKSDISLANFSGAILRQANLSETKAKIDAMHGWGANFTKTDFSYANLKKANLAGLFEKTNFSHANLSNAFLYYQTSDFYNPTKPVAEGSASWKGVDFTFANLTGAKFYSNSQVADISGAKFCQTVMPNGKINDRDCKK